MYYCECKWEIKTGEAWDRGYALTVLKQIDDFTMASFTIGSMEKGHSSIT